MKKFVLLIIFIFYLLILFKNNSLFLINNNKYFFNLTNDNEIKIYNIQIRNNSLLLYYFNYSKKLNYIYEYEKYCNNNVFINSTFNFEKIEKRIDFLILNLEKTKIENIFLLIILFPFINNNTTLLYKIGNRKDYKLFRIIFKSNNIKKLNIICFKNLTFLIDNFYDLISYEWEILPDKDLLNNVRFIINTYYNESFLKIFDKSLNINLKLYIKKINNLNFDIINKLMSKLLININKKM